MGILVILILSLGAVGITVGSICVPETARCSRYWEKLEPHKNLMESEHELNSWCRKERLFYRCLENVLLGKSKNMSDLPTTLLISKMFSEDLCLDGSRSRTRYLNNAACINQLNTEYCTLPEYLDIVTPDDAIPPSKCSFSEKTFSCIAATIVMNCGFDAGRVYRYLLKVTSYSKEVCDIDKSDGVPPCEDLTTKDPHRDEQLSEVFYGLVHRFGDLPEQEIEEDLSVSSEKTTDAVEAEIDETAISEAIRNALDAIEDSSSEESEAIRNALDAIEDSSSEEYEEAGRPQGTENSSFKATEQYSDSGNQESDEVIPIITEPFKGLLHYNYSGQEFVLYWRQPDNFPIENVECEHLLPSFLKGVIFRCVLNRRLGDPDCLASMDLEDEPLTPELIRDIDPDVPDDSRIDFGPRPFWMEELDEYKRQKELREQSTGSKFFESVSEASIVDSASENCILPATCTSETRIHEMISNPDFKWWKCPNLFSEELRKEIISVLLPDLTEDDIPLMSAFHSNNIGYVYLYESRFHEFESISCARVNECHPRGRGVFRCSVKPRLAKQCVNCYEESRHPSPAFDNLRKFRSPDFKTSEETGSTLDDGSGDKEYEPSSDELVTLLLTGDESLNLKEKDPGLDTEGFEGEFVAVDISTDVPEPSGTEDSPDLNLVLLDQGATESIDESDIVSDLVFTTEGVLNDQESVTYGLTSNEAYNLLDDNVFVLQAVLPNEADATYEIVESPQEDDTSKGSD